MASTESESGGGTSGKKTKFTPENIRQISNLVERGKNADEIAQIIGVTPGTLKATCSRLSISLRRPQFDVGTGLLRQRPDPPHSTRR
jgi:DNA-binding NarL/FixJ family response regulator